MTFDVGGLMHAEISAFKIVDRLDWSSLVLIAGLLIAARVLASAAGWLISHLAERAHGRRRLTVLKSRPIVRLLIAVGTVLLIIPILVQPTFENAVAILVAFGLVFAFALKDYGSSLVAGVVTVLEGTYQPGDWIEVDGAYGEVRSIGMRAVRIVTSEDTEVVIPHSKIWNNSVSNATSGSHNLLCVADFYLDPQHDALLVRQKLEDVALSSAYRQPDTSVTIVVAEKPWGTHYRVKTYVRDSREQFVFTTDITVRGKAMLLASGVQAARAAPVAAEA